MRWRVRIYASSQEARVSKTYRLTERAEADVEAIADFIADDSVDAAVKVCAPSRMRLDC